MAEAKNETVVKADKIKEHLTPPKKHKPVLTAEDFLSSGCDLINCALSGRVDGGYALGTVNIFAGDSESGKTLVCHNALAEASINKAFDKYLLIYDNPEFREFWALEKIWGEKLAKRIQSPVYDSKGRKKYSKTIQELYFNLDTVMKSKKPFIWVEDSMTLLYSEEDKKKFHELKTAAEKGKTDVSGSYGTSRAKINSDWLRFFIDYIEQTGSLLFFINQARDVIKTQPFDFRPNRTYSGGRTQKFHGAIELWTSIVRKHYGRANGISYPIGTLCRLDISKNSINGKKRCVDFSIYDDVGLDNTGTSVDWLIDIGHWRAEKKKGGEDDGGKKKKETAPIVAEELDIVAKRDRLIREIEGNNLEGELRLIVQKAWNDIEDQLRVERKPRYV